MNKPNVLMIVDGEDARVLSLESRTGHWHIFCETINQDELRRKVNEIKRLVLRNNIHFVLYSRNDQVGNRISIGPVTRELRTGYSSFSGIDEQDRVQQMKTCFEDFMKCDRRLDFNVDGEVENVQEAKQDEGTFSLVFDTEQLGDVRYGVPRILRLLNRYSVKATFFVTNLMKSIYPNLIEKIQGQGHEVGLHGMWHEFLSDSNEEEQTSSIRDMIRDFGGRVYGANFVGRMNEDTLHALVRNRIRYFVHPLMNHYRFTAYPKPRRVPRLVHLREGRIWMIAISLETYSSPWLSIKNMIDSALLQEKRKSPHISILCHPYRDGNLAHINITERMLSYLAKKGLMSVTLTTVNKLLEDMLLPSIDVEGTDLLFNEREKRFLLPQTKQDLFNILPENLIAICRTIKRGRTLF
nr:polysaccharide deacetylase family protein [Candidatus Njordarchaeota archaeon]